MLVNEKKDAGMDMTFLPFVNRLRNTGNTVLELETENDSRIAILPEYGRVIGLWTNPETDNLLWTNKSFAETKYSLVSEEWQNPGGDRLWLSPEMDFFISDQSDPWGTYSVPKCIDPGKYSYTLQGNSIELENSGTIKGFLTNTNTSFKIRRCLTPIDLSEYGSLLDEQISVAGYTEKTTLELTGMTNAPISYWNITQVPQGGIVRIGVKGNEPAVVEYIGNSGESVHQAVDGYLPVSFAGEEQFKIGVPAEDSSGSISYLLADSETPRLLVRMFDIDCDAEYTDVPPDGRPGKPCPVQLYFGADTYNFGELEYHSPAVRGNSISGSSKLIAFTGPASKLEAISCLLNR